MELTLQGTRKPKLRATTTARRQSPAGDTESADSVERDLCLRCNRSRSTCFCGFVTPFQTRTRFVLLMHDREFKRQKTGTGRLTNMALAGSEILMGVDFTCNDRLNQLLSDPSLYPVVLFPGASSANLSAGAPLEVPSSRRLLVLVIDGTWRKANRIMRLSANLQTVPRICFSPPAPSRFRIKLQPAVHCVSTIEAVYYLLELLSDRGLERLNGQHRTLLNAIDSLVEFQERYMPPRKAPELTTQNVESDRHTSVCDGPR